MSYFIYIDLSSSQLYPRLVDPGSTFIAFHVLFLSKPSFCLFIILLS